MKFRFSATIHRNVFHRKFKGVINNGIGIGNLLTVMRSILICDDSCKRGELDGITIRISRVKPRKSKP